MLEYRDTADGVNHSFFIVCYFYRLQVFIKTTHHKNIILHDIITKTCNNIIGVLQQTNMRFYSIYIDNDDDDDNDTYIDTAY